MQLFTKFDIYDKIVIYDRKESYMKRKKSNVILKILKICLISILSIIILINIFIIVQTKSKPNSVPGIFGYKPFIVLSGSMESKIKTGDLVIVKEIDSTTLKKGNIIAFRDSENLVTTHRIVKVIKTENRDVCFQTKGDANNTEDKDIVCSNSIEGKYQFKISKLGNVLLFIQKPLGFIIMMMSIFILGMITYIISNKKNIKETMFEDEKELEEFKEFKKMKEKNKK